MVLGIFLKNYKNLTQKNWAQHNIAHSTKDAPDKQRDDFFDNNVANIIEHSAYMFDEEYNNWALIHLSV